MTALYVLELETTEYHVKAALEAFLETWKASRPNDHVVWSWRETPQ